MLLVLLICLIVSVIFAVIATFFLMSNDSVKEKVQVLSIAYVLLVVVFGAHWYASVNLPSDINITYDEIRTTKSDSTEGSIRTIEYKQSCRVVIEKDIHYSFSNDDSWKMLVDGTCEKVRNDLTVREWINHKVNSIKNTSNWKNVEDR